MAASQGAAYSDNTGGKGYKFSKTLRLNKNDKLDIVVGTRPAWRQSGAVITVPGGNFSELYLNGELMWRCGGGASQRNSNIAPDAATSVVYQSGLPTSHGGSSSSVHWHSGAGKSGATHATEPWVTIYSTTFQGGCYGWAGHTHDKTGTCPWHYNRHEHRGCKSKPYSQVGSGSCPMCGHSLQGWTGEHLGNENEGYWNGSGFDAVYGCSHGCRTYTCGNRPLNAGQEYDCGFYNNTQTIQCGYANGEILSAASTVAGNCYVKAGSIFANPQQELTQSGNGIFSIRLAEQGTIVSNNMSQPHYTAQQKIDRFSSIPNGEKKINYCGADAKLVLFDPIDSNGNTLDQSIVMFYRRN